MTASQEAHSLIDRIPEESVEISPKKQAFLDMEEMRKESVKYDISAAQREAAMAEKYGE